MIFAQDWRESTSIRSSFTLAIVACLPIGPRWLVVVRVGAPPLNVDQIVFHHFQVVWRKIVFDRGINLNDVSSFASDVQVVNSFCSEDFRRTRDDLEDVRAILEDFFAGRIWTEIFVDFDFVSKEV